MKRLLFGLFLILAHGCSSDKDKAYSIIKKQIEDEAFEKNQTLKIVDLKITSLDKVSIDTLYNYQIIFCKNFMGFYKDEARFDSTIYHSDSSSAESFKKLNDYSYYIKLSLDSKSKRRDYENDIDSIKILNHIKDSIQRLWGKSNEKIYQVRYFLKAAQPGQNILDSFRRFYTLDWKLIMPYKNIRL